MQKLEPKFTLRTSTSVQTEKENKRNLVQDHELKSEDWAALEENLESSSSDNEEDSIENMTYTEKKDFPLSPSKITQALKIVETQNVTQNKGVMGKTPVIRKDNEDDIGLADGYRYELSGSFKAHTDSVRRLKFLNKSNRYFSSGSNDGTVAVYDLELQKVILCFRAHQEKTLINDLCWSSSNRFLLTSSPGEKSIKIWNYETKKKISSISVPTGVTSSCYNPVRHHHFAYGDSQGRIFWYNTQTRESKEIYRDFSIFENNSDFISPVTALAYGMKKLQSEQKKCCWLFCGNSAGRLEIFKYLQKKDQYDNLKHVSQKYAITNIIFSERLQSIIINSCDDKLKMYSVPQLDLIRVFFHPQRTFSLRCCIGPDSKIVITGSEDGQFRIFDIESGALLNSIQASNPSTPITSVDYSGDGVIISASNDGEVKVWTAPHI